MKPFFILELSIKITIFEAELHRALKDGDFYICNIIDVIYYTGYTLNTNNIRSDFMETVTTRRQGNAVAITLTKKLGIKAGETYYLSKRKDGSIIMIPKVKDIFENVQPQEYYDADTDDLVRDYQPKGAEKADD